MIQQIIEDFDHHQIEDFFDLGAYDTDYEISRHLFKSLRIGYILKNKTDDFRYAIYINFKRKKFTISGFKSRSGIEHIVFTDMYEKYSSPDEIYRQIRTVIKTDSEVRSLLFFKAFIG